MKLIKTLIIVSMLCLIVGCAETQMTKEARVNSETSNKEESTQATSFCVISATYENSVNADNVKFQMVDEVFSQEVTCSTDNDCYNFLLENDDYRNLAPEFEPYLACEKSEVKEVALYN